MAGYDSPESGNYEIYACRFPSAPESLFEAKGMRSFSVAPDGKGFFATMRTPDSGIVRQLLLVTNWFEELERLVPAARR